jgi:hypothetical protein
VTTQPPPGATIAPGQVPVSVNVPCFVYGPVRVLETAYFNVERRSIDHLGGAVTAQMAQVDLRQGEYLVCPYSRTAKGTWVLDGKPARLAEVGTRAEQLGEAIGAALAQSREDVEELTRDSQPARPLLDLLQVPDYATYAKGIRQVEVYRGGDTVELTPQRNEGGRRGFTPIDTDTRTLTSPSPDQLGTEVITAFSKAI